MAKPVTGVQKLFTVPTEVLELIMEAQEILGLPLVQDYEQDVEDEEQDVSSLDNQDFMQYDQSILSD